MICPSLTQVSDKLSLKCWNELKALTPKTKLETASVNGGKPEKTLSEIPQAEIKAMYDNMVLNGEDV
jgi:hypothetical protein